MLAEPVADRLVELADGGKHGRQQLDLGADELGEHGGVEPDGWGGAAWSRLRISRQPGPTGLFADDNGAVRLVQQVPTFDGLLDLAFTEITADGAGSPQVGVRNHPLRVIPARRGSPSLGVSTRRQERVQAT